MIISITALTLTSNIQQWNKIILTVMLLLQLAVAQLMMIIEKPNLYSLQYKINQVKKVR